MLSRFCLLLRGWGDGFNEFVKNDIKANVQKKEIKELMAVSYKFLQEVPSKLEIHCKKGMYISFNFDWYSHACYQ